MASKTLIGNTSYEVEKFPDLEEVIAEFKKPEFIRSPSKERFRQVNQALLKLIQKAPHESFLLSSVVDYIASVNRLEALDEPFSFYLFEFWLNHFSNLSAEEQLLIRGKIAGKYLPRKEFQALFPIGMNKFYPGTHFVSAHLSPDTDTTIASFFGWLDAFCARVGEGQHVWSLPGGPQEGTLIKLFEEHFGPFALQGLARDAKALTLTAADLLSTANWIKTSSGTLISHIDHGRNEKAIILVDEGGYYLGDWRSTDVEQVRQVVILFKAALRWFENNFNIQMINFFAHKDAHFSNIKTLIASTFDVKIKSCEAVADLSAYEQQLLDAFFKEIVKIKEGIEGTFSDLTHALSKQGLPQLTEFKKAVESFSSSELFDKEGKLKDERATIFRMVQIAMRSLDKAIFHTRDFAERMSTAIGIKYNVLKNSFHLLNPKSDVDEIRLKMGNYDFLTVVIPDKEKLFPIGVIRANDLRKLPLGTVSFRDFCNLDEVKMASYLTVISVIDHHKSSLQTISPPLAIIGDAQSCNTLVAEAVLRINEGYSLGGFKEEDLIKSSFKEDMRLNLRLLKSKIAFQVRGPYFIHPKREISEYFCFLQAILDDTDLLSKASSRDVECIAELLNRLKTLTSSKEEEILSLEDIKKDDSFVKLAVKRILQNPDMYSIYEKVFLLKEAQIREALKSFSDISTSPLFNDTKEQNGCCRVGQTKLFNSCYADFESQIEKMRLAWVKHAEGFFSIHGDLDLHVQMISTVPGAKEIFNDASLASMHQDEMWIWVPDNITARNHLARFLNAFQAAPEIRGNKLSLEIYGNETKDLEDIFERNFIRVPVQRIETGPKLAILKYNAGSLNSRKSMVTPYLPRKVP